MFPNRPVSEVFRDIPEQVIAAMIIIMLMLLKIINDVKREQLMQKLVPELPTSFPTVQGIRIEETHVADDVKVFSLSYLFVLITHSWCT